MAKQKRRDTMTLSSGNVFADLGLRDAAEKQMKVRLAACINQIINAQNLSQMRAARLLQTNQPKVSALANYRLEGFSVERLLHFLNGLNRDVEIIIRKRAPSRRPAQIVVREVEVPKARARAATV
jgi:predicted XRE-type DNA-binding protein